METPGLKKYTSDNIFLNTLSDLTRDAYKTDTKANMSDNPNKNRFDTDIILNSKESFDSNNQRLNSMQDEIITLKNKLKTVYEKDEEIQKLKNELEKIKLELLSESKKSGELNKFEIENKNLRDLNDKLQIEVMNCNSLQQENTFLKNKLSDLEDDQENNEEKKENSEVKKEKIKVDINKLKNILSNRLKSYHENHIEKLLQENELYNKEYIDKDNLEQILKDVIHI
jgi:septal ring factor EnvC (AmiA/AmiB activator)